MDFNEDVKKNFKKLKLKVVGDSRQLLVTGQHNITRNFFVYEAILTILVPTGLS